MNLKEYLSKNRITHREFAEKLDIHVHSLKNVVYGKRRPSLELALRIEELTEGELTPKDLMDFSTDSLKIASKRKFRDKKSN